MRPRLVTAGLVAFLLLACAGLGLTIGGSSGGTSPEAGGSSQSSSSNSELPPEVMVRAATFGLVQFQVGPLVSNVTGISGIYVDPQPIPLSGVKFVFTELGRTPYILRHAPFYVVFTNSSGLGYAYIPQGNYSVEADGPDFNFTTAVSMRSSTTAFLDLKVEPSLLGVATLEVSNPDGGTGVESSALMFAKVAGAFQYAPTYSYAVVGDLSGTQPSPHSIIILGVEVVGSYPALGGTWVVIKPAAPYSSIPTGDVKLVQYVANSTVTYAVH